MKLLIINSDFQNFQLFEKKTKFIKDEKFYLIDLTNKNFNFPNWMNSKFIDISRFIFFEYQKQKQKLKKIFLKNLKNSEFLEYKFSEINYADKIWKIYFMTLAINSFIKKKNIKELYIFSKNKNDYLNYALKKNTRISLVHFYSINNFYFNILGAIKTYLIFFNNFFQEFFLSIFFIFAKKNYYYNDKYLYSNFPNHWDLKERYYKLFDKNNKNTYLISLLRNNSNLLKDYKNFFLLKSLNLKKINILESYNSPLEIIFIYLKTFFSFNRKKTKNILKDLKLDFFLNEVERNYKLIEKSKNHTFNNSLKNFYKKNKFKKIIFPFFEFIDGRLISKFCNKLNIETNGFQHAYLTGNTYSRFFDATQIIYEANSNHYLPYKIFTESNYARKRFSSLKKLSVQCYGSFRLRNIKKFNKKQNAKNILFVMDLHNKVFLENIIKDYKTNSTKSLYIRPHPTYYDEFKNKIFKNSSIKIDLNKNLFESINKNKIKFVVISSSTSAFIDLIKTNLNIIIFKIPNYIRDDYIIDRYFFSINKLNSLRNLKVNNKMNIKKIKNIFLPPKIKKNFLINL